MPIYQYKCVECEHQLEALQRMSDAKLVDCPACDKPALKKQLTAAAFKLKGTGWYETDFKNSGAKPADKKAESNPSNSESSSSGSGEAVSADTSKSTSSNASNTEASA